MAKTGIMKVFDVKVKYNGEVVLEEKNLTSASLEKAVSTAEVRNGQQNSIWGSFSSEDKLTVALESNVVSLQRLQLLSGITPEEDPTEIVIKSGQYPEAFELVLTSPFINAQGKVEKMVEITIPSAKPEASWSLSTQADYTSPASSTINFTAQDNDGVLATMKFLDVDENGNVAGSGDVYYGLLKANKTTGVTSFANITEAMISEAVTAGTVTKKAYTKLNKVSLGSASESDIHIIVVPVGKSAKKFDGISSEVLFDEDLMGSANGQAITIGGENYLIFGEKAASSDTELFGFTY